MVADAHRLARPLEAHALAYQPVDPLQLLVGEAFFTRRDGVLRLTKLMK